MVKGIDLLTQATNADKEGRYAEALHAYSRSAQHLRVACKYEQEQCMIVCYV